MTHSTNETILVVDDDEDVLALIEEGLTSEGYRVLTAVDGDRGYRVATTECLPDAVVTDVDMPTLDGFGLTRKLKSTPTTRRVPVILLTKKDQVKDKIQGINAGAQHYLTKPFRMEVLLSKVRFSLDRPGRRAVAP